MYKQLKFRSGYTAIVGLGLAAIISGCASSSSDGVQPVFAEEATDTLAKKTIAKTAFAANGVKLVKSATPVTRGLSTVTLIPGDESLSVTAVGKTVTFTDENQKTAEGGSVYYEVDGQGWISLDGVAAEDVEAGKTNYTYMLPVSGGMATVTGEKWDRYYAVLGVETPYDVVAKKANAEYSGDFSSKAVLVNDPTKEESEKGYVYLNADFEDAKINGNVYFGKDKIALKETDISGNGFATTFDSGTSIEEGSVKGDFAGKFFGNDAQEAGGTIAYDYVGDEGDAVGAGTWTAKEGSLESTR